MERAEPRFGRYGVLRKNLFFSYFFLLLFFLLFFFLICFFSFFFILFFSSFITALFLFLIFFSFFFIIFLFFGVRRKEPVFLRTPDLPNKGSACSELRTCRTRVRPGSFSELRPCKGSEFGKGTHSEPGFGPVLTPNSEPARVRSSQKGTGFSRNSKPAEPGLYPFFLRTPNLPSQGYTRFFSEL